MQRQLLAMQAEVPGVLQAVDIECIHRMRVASRRLRAAQSLFDGFLPKRHVADWEKLIKRVTRSLGLARDLDIQLETIRRFRITVMDQQCLPGANRLYLRLLQSRSSAQKSVTQTVQKFELAGVLHYISPKLQKAIKASADDLVYNQPIYSMADQSIRQRLDELLSYEEYISQPERVTELHAMRIAAKRLRYTLEIFDPIYPQGLKQWLKPIKEIQELLGLIHDCDVWTSFLPVFIAEEKELTQAYFGHLRGFGKLLPGIEVFSLNREADRQRYYNQFLVTWKTSKRKTTWEKLRENVINGAPVEMITHGDHPDSQEITPEVEENGNLMENKGGNNENSPDQ